MTPPNKARHIANQDAYQSWVAARDALRQGIQAYIRTSNALGSSLASASSQSVALDHFPDHVSTQFDTELKRFPDEQSELHAAHLALLKSRNISTVFCRISCLPSEILSRIFLAAYVDNPNDDSSRQSRKFPNILASVCHSWRTIALGTPMLWSYLELIVRRPEIDETSIKCIDLWSHRSTGAQLCLDILVQKDLDYGNSERENYEYDTTDITIEKLFPILTPLAPRIFHLTIGLNLDSQNFLQSLLCCLVGLNMSSSIQSLNIWYNCNWKAFYAEPSSSLDLLPFDPTYEPDWDDDSAFETLLHSIQHLNLSSVNIPLDHKVYHGLVELRLSNIEFQTQDITAILEASPALRLLSLVDFYLEEDDNNDEDDTDDGDNDDDNNDNAADSGSNSESSPNSDSGSDDTSNERIALVDLQSIILRSNKMPGSQLAKVLNLIESGSHPLRVDLSLKSVESDTADSIRAFFSRSNVAHLQVSIAEPNTWFSLLNRSLRQLQTLSLEGCNLWDQDFVDFISSKETCRNPRKAAPWPQLHTVHLTDCWINKSILRCLLTMSSVQVFRFIDRRKPERQFASPNLIALESLQEEVSEYVTDVKCLGSRLYLTNGPIPSFAERLWARGL